MQGQNWNGPAADSNFNPPPFFNNDGSMTHEAMQSMFQGNLPNELQNQAFPGFAPTSAAMFSHPSQSMMQQHSGMGMQSRPMDADPSQRFVNNMPPNAMNSAAYSQMGFNASLSAPPSRRQSEKNNDPSQTDQHPNDGTWNAMSNNMQDYVQDGSENTLRAPSNVDFRHSINGYEADGLSSNSGEESAQGKRRRMTFTGAPVNPIQMQGANKIMLAHNETSSNSGISDRSGMGSTPMPGFGPDGQQQQQQHANFVRPPFRHRRSRSGSEAIGPTTFGQRSFSSVELGPGAQDLYRAGSSYPQPPSLYPAGQQHGHSFVGSQAVAAMGGHAASHPPGLGSQILRGVDVSASGSSAATDFTKRKGWTGRVVEELLDFVHVLDPEGTILFASPSVQGLTGWKSEELKGRKLTEFVHPQDVASVEREIDRMRSSKGELLTYYRFKTKRTSTRSNKKGDKASKDSESSAGDTGEEIDKDNERRSEAEHADAFTRDGDYIVFEATGHPYFPPEPPRGASTGPSDSADSKGDVQIDEDDSETTSKGSDGESQQGKVKSEKMVATLSSTSKAVHPLSQEQRLLTPNSDATSTSSRAPLQCFFCSARPYPSKNTSMLDSFLELKLENEKLRLLIADMDLTGPEHEHDRNSLAAAYHPDLLKQELENDAMTGGWAHAVNPMFGSAAIGSDSRVMSTPSGQRPVHDSRQNSLGSHPTSPLMRTVSARDEVLAGLGVSAADDSDEELGENQNNANDESADANAAEDARRKKKPKQDDGDHVCTDCGRVNSPEWRKGPLGPKTLCNACGLRWAKKIKRKGGDPNMAAGLMAPDNGMPPAPGVGGASMGMNVGIGSHMMAHGSSMQQGQGHPHPFNRADSGQLQGMPIQPPGSLPPGMNMHGMGSSSANGFSNRNLFDENPHQHQNNGLNNMGGGGQM